jgi:uncharacterized protein (TIGR03083 family)
VELLPTYVRAWRETADDVGELGAQLTDSDWQAPTDCPGWRARDVLAHLVDIEEWLTTDDPGETRDGPMSEWTQVGVDQRQGASPPTLLTALATAVERRAAQLAAEPPDDPQGSPPRVPAGLPWSWETLLRNRAIDMWVHSQDIRRAVGRPGGYDLAGAYVTIASFSRGLPYVLGKKVAPPSGTVVVWDIDGTHPTKHPVAMTESGRAVALQDLPDDVDVRLGMDTETFVILAAGRRDPDEVTVRIDGDRELAARVLRAMVLTF